MTDDQLEGVEGRVSEIDPSASTPSLAHLSSPSSPGPGPQSQGTESTPTMGPDFYQLRREQWLSPSRLETTRGVAVGDAASSDADIEDGRARLENVLASPGAEEDDELWDSSLANVYNGLIGGKRFKKGVKLSLAVKILKAGWLRDGTWDTAAASSAAMSADGAPPSMSLSTISRGPCPPSTTKASHLSTLISRPPSSHIKGLRALITSALPSINNHEEESLPSMSLVDSPPPSAISPRSITRPLSRIIPSISKFIPSRRGSRDDSATIAAELAKVQVAEEHTPTDLLAVG